MRISIGEEINFRVPEACGLRHLGFGVSDLSAAVKESTAQGIPVEPIRKDELTGCYFTFFPDPDHLPLELYECPEEDPHSARLKKARVEILNPLADSW
ncbi:MAG: hypothetical protein Q6L68_00190 [Thermostichus sp. DG02_5_bins_236]